MNARGVGIGSIVLLAACATSPSNEPASAGDFSNGKGGETSASIASVGSATGNTGATSATGGSGAAGGSSSSSAGGGPPCQSDADCDDGVFCNGAEVCLTGVCHLGSSPCDDKVPCTLDTCDEATDACGHVPQDALCSDG